MTSGPECEQVERPLLEQLFSLGWETLIWAERQPDGIDLRSSDRDVLLERRLRAALLKINRGPDGEQWLDEARVGSAIAEQRSPSAGVKLLEANRASTELLLGGVTVRGLEGWDGGRDQAVNYIDWDNWEINDFLAWKDPHPSTVADVAASLGKAPASVTEQELLVAGMLAPERILDIVRHFTLFVDAGSGRTVKVVGRYQQYRSVHKALRRLVEGDTRPADGHVDRRGGIVWHTQGSGKSLTMVFLIRAMRSHPDLRRFKIVLVTDRTELERQLRDTAALTGETVKVARNAAEVRDLLSQDGPGLVMAMIQKYRDTGGGDGEGLGTDERFDTISARPSSSATRPPLRSWRPPSSSRPRPGTCCATT